MNRTLARIAATFAVLLLASPGWAYDLAAFSVDVTIPMDHACMGGGIKPSDHVVDPLYVKGVVLRGGDKPFVLAAIDWCEIRNDAFDAWRAGLAEAAGTTPDHVLFSSIHQHNAPVADFYAQSLLDAQGLEKALCDVPFVKDCIARTAAAIRESLEHPQPVTHYGAGEGEVMELASNRRIVADDGSVNFNRGSATGDASIRDKDVGTHDPMLKTISFWNGDTPVAAFHAYATHPMSYYGNGGVSADFVGIARHFREMDQPDVLQVYVSGCSGDVTAGKWNDGAPENRYVLAGKIYRGMVAAWESTKRFPLESLTLRMADLNLEPKASAGFTEDDMKAILADTSTTTFKRILAAMGLSWRHRVDAGQPIQVAALDFGKACYLLMPAESFVGYQLMAQKIRPDALVFTAGYGECAPGYIPTAAASAENFNDLHDWCWVAPGAEPPMQEAMEGALGR